jgi:hypothetical protein
MTESRFASRIVLNFLRSVFFIPHDRLSTGTSGKFKKPDNIDEKPVIVNVDLKNSVTLQLWGGIEPGRNYGMTRAVHVNDHVHVYDHVNVDVHVDVVVDVDVNVNGFSGGLAVP